MKVFTLKYASTTLHFGNNVVSENLAKYLNNCKRVVLATGKRSAKLSGVFDDVVKILAEKGIEYEVFNDITPNP